MARSDGDLLKTFFDAQCREPSKNDWCLSVLKDLEYLDLDNDYETVKYFSKESLSSEVKNSCREKAFEDLMIIKDGYSKGSNVEYGQSKMRSYLKSTIINPTEAKLIFKF